MSKLFYVTCDGTVNGYNVALLPTEVRQPDGWTFSKDNTKSNYFMKISSKNAWKKIMANEDRPRVTKTK